LTLRRRHVFQTYANFEVDVSEIIAQDDWKNREMMLWRGRSDLDHWQLDAAYATWRAMQKSMSTVADTC
jgi:hypothetical protein